MTPRALTLAMGQQGHQTPNLFVAALALKAPLKRLPSNLQRKDLEGSFEGSTKRLAPKGPSKLKSSLKCRR